LLTQVDAEKVDALTERFGVETVPCFVMLQVSSACGGAAGRGRFLNLHLPYRLA
jgi:hypothetical protein